MRWSIIRLIWLRELRDQLRDRRTLFMIAGLPLLLYPVLGLCVVTFALQFFAKPSRVGLVRPSTSDAVFPARATAIGPAAVASFVGHLAPCAGSHSSFLGGAIRGGVSESFLVYPPLAVGDAWHMPVFSTRYPSNAVLSRLKIVWL